MSRRKKPERYGRDAHVTLEDIGKKLGLSRATISLALRNHPRISTATKERISIAARQMGYQPDQVARALATGRSNLIGVVVPNTADHVYAEVFRGIEDAAQAAGYHVLLSNGSYDPDHTAARIREMMRLKLGGIMAAPPFQSESSPLPPLWREIKRSGFPLVLLNRELNPAVFDQVTIDNRGGIRLAMECLASLGHKRVAYITGSVDMIPIRQRYDAFREYSSKYGFEADAEMVEYCELSAKGGYESCAKLWSRLRKKPTAIMVFSDAPSLGVIRYLSEHKVRIPEEVSVIGFDGTDSSEFSQISLSTVATPMYEMGKQAFHMLEETMERRQSRPRSILLPVQLVRRESVARANGSRGARKS
jgi:DNA-binding LacI/PurR family transcriptional regulator